MAAHLCKRLRRPQHAALLGQGSVVDYELGFASVPKLQCNSWVKEASPEVQDCRVRGVHHEEPCLEREAAGPERSGGERQMVAILEKHGPVLLAKRERERGGPDSDRNQPQA